MPQMSPMWWEILMITFMLIMFMFMLTIYHNNMTKNKPMMYSTKISQLKWSW
nr:ATP synthase F0 subunit 8 [Urochela rubra]